jgi:hypothetical protein
VRRSPRLQGDNLQATSLRLLPRLTGLCRGRAFFALIGLTWGTVAIFALALGNFSAPLAEFLPPSRRKVTVVLRIASLCLLRLFFLAWPLGSCYFTRLLAWGIPTTALGNSVEVDSALFLDRIPVLNAAVGLPRRACLKTLKHEPNASPSSASSRVGERFARVCGLLRGPLS